MRDDYLWDGSGEPDPEIQRLETLLGRLRHRGGQAPGLPARAVPFPRRRLSSWMPLPAAAAAMLLVAAGVWVSTRGPTAAWRVTSVEGRPLVGANRIGDGGRLTVGQWLETDAGSRARMDIGDIGQLEIEPNTRVRLMKAHLTEQRMALERGKIHATIWAPPRQFFVEMPSAVAVDLGCAYTLEVDKTGAGLVRTTYGWVGFEWKGRESFVPAGAACATLPGVGPGTPYFEDAPEALRGALSKLDFEAAGTADRAALLDAVLDAARPQDALTLWHLLARVNHAERSKVYDRLAALAPLPTGVTREAALGLDKRALDLWWDSLGLGEASWWRLWKGPYPGK